LAASRRVPAALAVLAGLGAVLWGALRWQWSIAGGAAAQQFLPLVIETGTAGIIAVATYGPSENRNAPPAAGCPT
jgi:hypothetical protein